MTTSEWRDFVISVGQPIRSVEERFNLEGGGRSVRRELFEQYGDKFEVMEITDLGGITIWTTTKVWCIRTEQRLEKLVYLPRNPPALGNK
jgi:hypothetical protein